VAEQAAHLLEIAVLLVDLHRHAVTEVIRLQHRVADEAAVGLAEPPDVLAFHRSLHQALAPLSEGGPEQRRVGLHVVDFGRQVLSDVPVEVLHHGGGQGNVASFSALHGHGAEAPPAVQVADSARGHRLASHS
jgi:hypothetical protein